MPRNVGVSYLNFGIRTAAERWNEGGELSYGRFKENPTRGTAISFAGDAWHIHEWLWHEQNPGVNTQGNTAYVAFRERLFDECPQLEWVRDIADASKHCGLGRAANVMKMTQGPMVVSYGGTLVSFNGTILSNEAFWIELSDKRIQYVADVLGAAYAFWNERFRPID